MPIRLGIIGLSADPAAWATVAHITPLRWQLSKDYIVVALATSSLKSAQAAAAFHGIPSEKAYSNPEDLANDPDVDMVVVSVKVPLHTALTLPALYAKKSVFVEWPLGNGAADAREMAALAKSHSLKTIVGLQARASPTIIAAKSLIATNAIGRVKSSTLTASSNLFHTLPSKNVYTNEVSNGANLLTIGAGHDIDAFCFVLGEFAHLNAQTAVTYPESYVKDAEGKISKISRTSPDWTSVHSLLENGATANCTWESTTDPASNHLRWVIHGDSGSLKIKISDMSMQVFQPDLYRSVPSNQKGRWGEDGGKWEKIETGTQMAFGGVADLYKAFAEGNNELLVDFEGAVKRHEMIEAIVRSSEKGTRETY